MPSIMALGLESFPFAASSFGCALWVLSVMALAVPRGRRPEKPSAGGGRGKSQMQPRVPKRRGLFALCFLCAFWALLVLASAMPRGRRSAAEPKGGAKGPTELLHYGS